MNCAVLVVLATVLVIFMPVFSYGILPGSGDSASIGTDEPDTITVSDLGRQIDILAYKFENLETSLKQILQSVIKTNEYTKTELFESESDASGVIKNIVSMIASERQEIENALNQQRELKVLLDHYVSVLKKKTAVLEEKADSSAKPPATTITEIENGPILTESEPAPQKNETAAVTKGNTLIRKNKNEGTVTDKNLAIGLLFIFGVVLFILTLTICKKMTGKKHESGGLGTNTVTALSADRDSQSGANGNVDHSLPIVVSDAIFKMRMTMRFNERLKAIEYPLSRMENAIMRHGYTIVDLTGKPYENEQSLKVVNIVERDDIGPGTTIINRMLKPRIMYDKIIVSHGAVELATSSKPKN